MGARRRRAAPTQSLSAKRARRLRPIDLRRTIRLMARLEGLEIVREFQRNVRRVIKADAAVFIAAVAIVSAVIGCLQWYFIHRHFSSEAAELKVANVRLDSTIRSLESTIEYQDTRIQEFSGRGDQADKSAISKVQLVNSELQFPQNPLRIKFYFKNLGAASASGFIHVRDVTIAEMDLSNRDLDEFFAALKSNIRDAESRRVQSRIRPDETVFFTVEFANLNQNLYDQVVNGRKYLYLFLLTEYRDAATPPKKWRGEEICLFMFKDHAMHSCSQHNRAFLSD
jgi:hypothetical protein